MKEMNHALIESSPGELGVGCKCGKRFPTQKTAEGHVADQNLIEANEAKAKAAAEELAKQAKEPAEPKKEAAEVEPEPKAAVATPTPPEPTNNEKPPALVPAGEPDDKPQPPAPQPA